MELFLIAVGLVAASMIWGIVREVWRYLFPAGRLFSKATNPSVAHAEHRNEMDRLMTREDEIESDRLLWMHVPGHEHLK